MGPRSPWAALLVWFLAASILTPGILTQRASAQSIPVEQLLASEEDPAVLSDAGQQLAARKQLADAQRFWEKALELSPNFFAALFNLGYMHFSGDRFEKAAGFLERAAWRSSVPSISRILNPRIGIFESACFESRIPGGDGQGM